MDIKPACPNGDDPRDVWRESVDVGIGIIYGPWGCEVCGWSSDPIYDRRDGPKWQNGYLVDQWGMLDPTIKEKDYA